MNKGETKKHKQLKYNTNDIIDYFQCEFFKYTNVIAEIVRTD